MQTILGSTGAIGTATAKELTQYTDKLRLVSRNPKKVNENDELVAANLLSKDETLKAVNGSEVVYLTAGIKYRATIWEKEWMPIIKNVVHACKSAGAKLVFFDNVYPYGYVKGKMTEDSPINPISRKGEVRRKVDEYIMNEVEKGELKAILARSADFYGPGADLSILNILVLNKMLKGKAAQWTGDITAVHSLTYTPDAAKAYSLLGNTESAYNKVWHLPTSGELFSVFDYIKIAAEHLNIEPKYNVISNFMMSIAGIFVKDIAEIKEMNYQMEHDYIFDSSKFNREFNFQPTPYKTGIIETLNSLKLN